MNRNLLKQALKNRNIRWHKHAFERMMERGISREMVMEVLLNGEELEDYPHDRPLPSALYFYVVEFVPLHVVVALDETDRICHVITAYRPDEDHFEEDHRTRKEK